MKVRLIERRPEVAGVESFIFQPEAPLTWRAGQYMRYHIENPAADERRMDRFFTISAAPFEQNLRITTRFASEHGSTFKRDLQKLQVSDTVEAFGPSGNFVIEEPNNNYVFIAGGIGITPFRSVLLDLDHNNLPMNITLLYANRNQDIVFRGEFDQLAEKHIELKIKYVIDPERIDENIIRQAVPDLNLPYFYISGPKPMVDSFVELLTKMGVSKDKIKTDFFPGYTSI